MAGPGNQTTLLNTLTLPELTDLVRKTFIFQNQHIERNARQLFIEEFPDAGDSKRYDEYDVETYANFKPEGVDSKKSKGGVGYNVTMNSRTFSKELEITIEMRRHNRYKVLGGQITSLAGFCENRLDLDLTHRFTFAGSTSYTDLDGETVTTTVGDGLALLSASHTLAFSSTTYNNIVTGAPAFSETSLESALLIAATQVFSNFGEKRNMNYNTIVTGNDPGTMRTVQQLLRSTADPDAVQSGVANVYSGKYNHVVLPNLATTAAGAYDSTKRRFWFLVAAGQEMLGWQAYVGIWMAPQLLTPNDANAGMDVHNLNWTYSTYSMHGVVVARPQGLVGSNVVS